MSFELITTTLGATKIAAATAGDPLNITTFKAGDGNGVPVTPNPAQTDLVNTKFTVAVNNTEVSGNEVTFQSLIDTSSITPFTLREMGLFDDDGDLIYLANTADIDLEPLSTGIGFNFAAKMKTIITDLATVVLTVDPNVTLATELFVTTITDALDLRLTAVETSVLPAGVILDYAGGVISSDFFLCDGAEYDELIETTLFAAIGSVYNTGGETAGFFRVPDVRGRVTAGKDNMGGVAANRLTVGSKSLIDGSTLGASGGVQEHKLIEAELANHNHTGTTSSDGSHTHTISPSVISDSGAVTEGPDNPADGTNVGVTDSAGTHSHTLTVDATTGDEFHTNTPPTIVFNKIIKR